MLQYYGHQGEVQVLDGGINAYLAAGRRTDHEFVTPRPADYPVPTATDESIRITPDEIVAGIATDSLTLCDVRTPKEFSGEVAMSGRGGHIPGAINITWDSCLDADGKFLSDSQLAEVLTPYLDDSREQVTYCQGGIRASLTWFALQILLGRKARLYAASWEEWAQHPPSQRSDSHCFRIQKQEISGRGLDYDDSVRYCSVRRLYNAVRHGIAVND